jgi:serine/threonine-protein kinase
MKLAAARKSIHGTGLVTEVHYVPSNLAGGTVVAQSPAAGKGLKRGEHVLVNVSRGPKPQATKTVPNVVGQNETAAASSLSQAGFAVERLDSPTTDQSENGVVVDEQPAGGSSARAGSHVTIYVGRYSQSG